MKRLNGSELRWPEGQCLWLAPKFSSPLAQQPESPKILQSNAALKTHRRGSRCCDAQISTRPKREQAEPVEVKMVTGALDLRRLSDFKTASDMNFEKSDLHRAFN